MLYEFNPVAAAKIPAADRNRILENPGCGEYFTDHMASVHWTSERGWHNGLISPYKPLQLDPANLTLQYSQSVFDGLKAFRQPDGSVALFRPAQSAARLRRSARRLAMPDVPVQLFLDLCNALVQADRDWVPFSPESSLYLRPLLMAEDRGLRVGSASRYRLLIIASPAVSHFRDGVKPISVWLATDAIRAAPGGIGAAKTGANYAASMATQAEAEANGCEQVVWLDAVERKWLEGLSAMNLLLVRHGGHLLTPPVGDTVLPGITRDSIIRLARGEGFTVTERKISLKEWKRGITDGSLTEAFSCGTTAAVAPIGKVRTPWGDWIISDGSPGDISLRLRRQLLEIQTGRAPDPYGWLAKVV
ncbi:branched-chain amino acid aminotransferase [Streptomyces sp. NPDC127051]|uniref:branched-chain amino acid aminotransferase n=1 Tax=Streptomyces sp. NPDC127051 TaxID=3347119 RepID=UPI0036565F7A